MLAFDMATKKAPRADGVENSYFVADVPDADYVARCVLDRVITSHVRFAEDVDVAVESLTLYGAFFVRSFNQNGLSFFLRFFVFFVPVGLTSAVTRVIRAVAHAGVRAVLPPTHH